MSRADRPPSAAICASDRSTKITSRAITWSPRYDNMATSTMHATNGGIISWRPLISPPLSVARGAARPERPGELGHPEVHQVEVRVDAGCAAGVRGYDHGLRPGLLRHLHHLAAVVVVGGEQHLDVLLPHLVDHFEHVARSRRNAGLRLDVIDAGDAVFPREVVPLLVVAGDQFAPERQAVLEPAAQAGEQWGALILLRLQEVEQLALPVQVGERRTAEQLHELVAEQRPIYAVLEVLLARREVLGVLG